MDRNDRNILILGILILVVLAVAYYFLLFSPLRQDYLAKYDERTRREAQKQQLEQTAAQLENIRRNAADIERQILELSKRIPEQAELPTLVVQIEEVAEVAEVTQFSIEPGAPKAPLDGGNFSRIPITMTFVGRYEQMQDFLLRLRNLARLVTVNEVTYCRSPEPISDANCPTPIKRGGGETTGVGTTREGTTREANARVNNDVESLLEVQVVAEVYVQPAADGGEKTAATPPPAPADGGAAKGKAGAEGGGAAK